jgi:O-acetylhomoserine (thiol)-lyase
MTGQNIVSVSELYGGTADFFSNSLKNQGIEVRYASHNDFEMLENHIDENTTLVFANRLVIPSGTYVI